MDQQKSSDETVKNKTG